MAQQNQLLFNLHVPCNPMNMVTQFHNPGPVVIERLAGKTQTGQGEVTHENPQEPVQFSVISKEKLSFAMQLARRDMKNKIREQQQQHYKHHIREREESSKLQKKAGKKKILTQKASKLHQKHSSPDAKKSNVNLHRRSVKTQTPPPKRSPVLVLQSRSQPYDNFERRVKGTQASDIADALSKPTTSIRSVNLQQKQEISRLNKELKTCVERINSLSKQVSDSAAASSPDRTATLRAGLEALMRADPNQGQRSEVMRTDRRQQKKPVERRRLKNSSVILPLFKRSRHHRKDVHASAEGSMHFAHPTESSKSKAIAAGDVFRRVMSKTSPRGVVKLAWAPPGSPQSFRKVGLSRQELASPRVTTNVADYEEIESVDSSPGRGRMGMTASRDLQDREEHPRHHTGDRNDNTARAGPKHMWIDRGGSHEWRSGESVTCSERTRTKSNGQLINSLDTESAARGRYANIDYKSSEGHRNQLDRYSEEARGHKPSARRRVLFDHPAESSSSVRTIDHERPVQSHGTSVDSLPSQRGMRTSRQREDEAHRYTKLYGRLDDGQEIGPSEKYGTKRKLQTAKPTLKNTKEQITDLLVDEILEDAVQELERLDNDTMVTRQALIMEDAPTFESLLQELEYMEMEEERIRRRWKQVKYHDPQASGSVEGQVSKVNEVWMKGSPLDAQQMERLSDIPTQHTAISFTNTGHQGSHGNIFIHSSIQDNPTHNDDEDLSNEARQSNQAVYPSPSRPFRHGIPVSDFTSRGHPLEAKGNSIREYGGIPVFVPSDTMKRIQESRDEFETHLKHTSHLPYGTFDPWKLVEKISDELVDDVISSITEEVSDVIGNYVETLYATEFDVNSDDTASKEKARKSLFI